MTEMCEQTHLALKIQSHQAPQLLMTFKTETKLSDMQILELYYSGVNIKNLVLDYFNYLQNVALVFQCAVTNPVTMLEYKNINCSLGVHRMP